MLRRIFLRALGVAPVAAVLPVAAAPSAISYADAMSAAERQLQAEREALTAEAMARIGDMQTSKLVEALTALQAEVAALRAENRAWQLRLTSLAA